MPTIDLPILQNVEAISSCRDRDALSRIVLQAAEVLLGKNAEVAIFARMPQGETVLKHALGATDLNPLNAPWPALLDKIPGDGQAHTLADNGRLYGALPLISSEIASDHQILVYATDEAGGDAPLESLSCLVRIYGNQISLLDYSELDTLTHLLNR